MLVEVKGRMGSLLGLSMVAQWRKSLVGMLVEQKASGTEGVMADKMDKKRALSRDNKWELLENWLAMLLEMCSELAKAMMMALSGGTTKGTKLPGRQWGQRWGLWDLLWESLLAEAD